MANTKGHGKGGSALRSGAATATRALGEDEPDEVALCEHDPCGCEEADVMRGGQRFCSEACADMAAEADENDDASSEDQIRVSGEEQCVCGHAECEAAMTAGAGEESGTGRNVPRSPSGRE